MSSYGSHGSLGTGTPDQSGKRRERPMKAAPYSPCTPPAKREVNEKPRSEASLTVIVHRVDLFDAGCSKSNSSTGSYQSDDEDKKNLSFGSPSHLPKGPCPTVAPYCYQPHPSIASQSPYHETVAVVRTPTIATNSISNEGDINGNHSNNPWMSISVIDKSIPCPYGADLAKYWAQRRRLFRLFDHGIELDETGWFSVTPEQIADHTARRVLDLFQMQLPETADQQNAPPIVILDAFCGCGGNAIAFAKLIPNAVVVAVEVNRAKLLMAAKNASIYNIPSDKIIFCECNALFILEHCYKNGQFVLDQPLTTPEAAMALMAAMPPPVETQVCSGGYVLGGIDVLPRMVNAVYMDPPWGGVDYNVFGKNGYDLGKNMWIQRSAPVAAVKPEVGSLGHDFFDSFETTPVTKAERKAHFNSELDHTNCINGVELLKLAAEASNTHLVVYDLPRNINRGSLGSAGLAAGYRGNCKLEEHYLNGRLKTVTAYFGSDWSPLVKPGSTYL
jgi:trimethylguanosine synthase